MGDYHHHSENYQQIDIKLGNIAVFKMQLHSIIIII